MRFTIIFSASGPAFLFAWSHGNYVDSPGEYNFINTRVGNSFHQEELGKEG